jgi:hypothetical protein
MNRADLRSELNSVRAYARHLHDDCLNFAVKETALAQERLDRGLRRPVLMGSLIAALSVAGTIAGILLSVHPDTKMPWGTVLANGEPLLAVFVSALVLALFYIVDSIRSFTLAPRDVAKWTDEATRYRALISENAEREDYLVRAVRRQDFGPLLGMFLFPRARHR